MPTIERTARIDVRASADAAFAVVARDILAVKGDPDAMSGHRPLDEGPLRPGFRWIQTLVHDRKHCRTDWVVTEIEPPFLLEQNMEHLCAVSQREVLGGERWELDERADGSRLVTLRAWQAVPGLSAWARELLRTGLGSDANLSLKKRLAYVQFEAERRGRRVRPHELHDTSR